MNDGVLVADPYVNFPQYSDVGFVMNDLLDYYYIGSDLYVTSSNRVCTITADSVTKTYGATWIAPSAQTVAMYAHEIGHCIGCPHTGWVYGTYDSVWDVESGGVSFNRQLRGSYYSVAVKMKGVEFLRNLYSQSGLSIRPKAKLSKIEQIKLMIEAWGMNPNEILSKEALSMPNRTVVDPMQAEIDVLEPVHQHSLLKQ